jgi:phage tail-like protein
MDVNQTRFQLVYGPADWLPAASGGSPAAEPLFDWNPCDATLSLHQNLFIFPTLTGQVALDAADRRGSARDRYGNWYWIAESQTELRFLSMKPASSAQHFWSSSDEVRSCGTTGDFFSSSAPQTSAALTFSGLAVTPDHYLVVGIVQPKGLLVFDLYAGGPPSQLLWPANVPFEPFDMAVAGDGSVFILDRANRCYWKLDRNLQVQGCRPASAGGVRASVFQPVSGTPSKEPSSAAGPVTQNLSVPLQSLRDPVAIECFPDGSVLILDNPPLASSSEVHRFQNGVETGPPANLAHALAEYVPATLGAGDPDPQAVRGYDFAFNASSSVPGAAGTLYIAQIYGDQSFAFAATIDGSSFSLSAQPRYFPMRQFEGKAIVAAGGCVYYDFQELWVPLVEQPRPQYQLQAQLVLPQPAAEASPAMPPTAFDGKRPGCIWHRLFLDACIPPGASVSVESRAADLQSLLPSTPWQTEPQPYLRDNGCEIPYVTPQLQGAADRTGTWELLFQSAVGRYLQLRLTLSGNGRNSPRLQALRAYYPRFSYLRQYLPAVYQSDPVSASFLDRYLANVEGFFTVLEGKIEQVQELFDPRVVPAEYLDWLASWLSIVLDPSWSRRTRRLVLSHAPQMFFERGTPNGILRAISLMLDPCPDESLFDESNSTASSALNSGSGSCCNACSGSGSSTQSADIYSVRIVENFLTRSSPLLGTSDAAATQGLGVIGSGSTGSTSSAWTPAQGAAPLTTMFRCYLESEYATIADLNAAWGRSYSGFDDPNLVLPPVRPPGQTEAADWGRFLRDGLEFTYAPVSSDDLSAYQSFLSERYNTISDLNAAWNLTGANVYASFASVLLPTVMPSGGTMLVDWIRFVSVALPIQQNAHRFTVLVPVNLTDSATTQQTKLAVAQRVANIEKPAHTSFDVKLYWAMFCVGEARLGQDTLLGPGSRFAALVLGTGSLSAANLAPAEPIYARDRKELAERTIVRRCCESKPQGRCV